MVVLGLILLHVLCAARAVTGAATAASTDPAPAQARSLRMASIDYTKVPIQEKPLHTPPLEELADVLSRGLKSYFAEVEVAAAECPDLTDSPFNLTSPGLSGDEKLVEVGGVPYLMPLVQRDKIYDLAQLARHLRRDPAFLCGAGAGPWPHLGVNCEGIVNLSVRNESVEQGTRIAYVTPAGGYQLRRLPPSDTRSALLGNYLLSDGRPGTVLKVVAKDRINDANYITAIRETLKSHYGDRVVGLGGTFVMRAGRARFHVMPDFSETALRSDDEVNAWLRFFEMRAPLTHVGTLVTGDLGLDLRVQHFHGWGEHGDGGHYHYDTTPRDVHYEGYFAVGRSVLRVDAPAHTHAFGRD